MGAIAAVLDKKGRDTTKTAVDMLKTLKHKGAETYGIASATHIKIEKFADSLEKQRIDSFIAIGHVFSKTLPQDRPQPIKLENATLVFEGRIYPTNPPLSDVEIAAERLKQNPEKSAQTLIEKSEGNFAFAVTEADRLVAGRDSLGVRPLYYGENSALAALASERKALWKIGVEKAYSFPPGHLAFVDKHGFKFKPVKKLAHGETKQVSMQVAAENLRALLEQSIKERVAGLNDVAVAFSGGLDSSLIAYLAKKAGANVHLISVSLKKQPEIEYAEKAAEELKLPIYIRLYSEQDVEKVLPKVLWLIEETDPVKASIGIPFYWTAESTAKMGLRVMMAGQGADELFGGYKRYLSDYSRYGKERVQKIISNDVTKMYETNFERDSKICNFHNVELRLPFATYQIAKFAIGLPLKLKIKSASDMQRKLVLRQTAKNIELPSFIATKPKKAIQYATGVSKTLERLAKKRGLSTWEYLQKIFRKIIEEEMREQYSCNFFI